MIGSVRSGGAWVATLIFVGLTVGGSIRGQEKPAPVTFNRDIAPLILRNCVSCHRKGGTAPFALTAYENVREHGKEIAAAVEAGEMPPWLPDPKVSPRFRHERKLEKAEAEKFSQWVESGMAEGDPARRPEAFEFPEGWQLGEPDLVITLSDPVEMPAEGAEVFRNFVIPGLPAERKEAVFVRAVEFEPGSAGSIVRAAFREDATGTGRRLDALDEAAGFPGIIGGTIPGSPVLSWNPGMAPEPLRDGVAWPLNPGSDLILQLHLAPNGKAASVQPRIGFYFSDQPPRAELETIHLGAAGLAIPAGTKQARVTDQVALGSAVRLYSILPHAHRLATRFAAWAALPDGNKMPLILIPDWDFRWRQEYQFAEPISLPAGSVLHMEVNYDNSPENQDDPNQPPADVRWGPLSEDEMADVWFTVAPEDPGSAERLRSAVYFNDLRRQVTGYQVILKGDPGNFEANSQIGHILVNQQKFKDAIPFLAAALKARPDDSLAWHNRGMARFFLGDLKGARLNFRKAIGLAPEYAPSHNAIASAYSLSGELEESIPHFRKYLELRPEDYEIWTNFAVILTKLGRLDEAEREYIKIVGQWPDQPGVLSNYGKLLARQGRVDDGLKALRRAAELDPADGLIRFQTVEVLRSADRFEEARKEIEAILKIDPANETALEILDDIENEIRDAAAPPQEPKADSGKPGG